MSFEWLPVSTDTSGGVGFGGRNGSWSEGRCTRFNFGQMENFLHTIFANEKYFPYVRHPKSLLPPGDERRSDRILKHFIDTEVSEHTCLVVRDAEFFSNSSRLVRHHQVAFARGSHEWTPIAEVRQISFIAVHVAEIVLAADQYDGRLRAESTCGEMI